MSVYQILINQSGNSTSIATKRYHTIDRAVHGVNLFEEECLKIDTEYKRVVNILGETASHYIFNSIIERVYNTEGAQVIEPLYTWTRHDDVQELKVNDGKSYTILIIDRPDDPTDMANSTVIGPYSTLDEAASKVKEYELKYSALPPLIEPPNGTPITYFDSTPWAIMLDKLHTEMSVRFARPVRAIPLSSCY